MANTPSIPKGTRDFSPEEMLRRQYIFDTIRAVFQRYGYQPLETPAMEHLDTLVGKYGEEGDRLIFKVLNSGDAWARIDPNVQQHLREGRGVPSGRLASELCEKALRYDLTVPFARYVVQHQNSITFPFKRYQIQPVWRADRPQKGRYREFFQCDADVIGSTSLLNEVDLVLIIKEVFDRLGLKVRILVNDRKILRGLAQLFRVEDRLVEFVTILDKFDKIGNAVIDEYVKADFSKESVELITDFIEMKGAVPSTPRGSYLMAMMAQKEVQVGLDGFKDLEFVREAVANATGSTLGEAFDVDVMLARGLDYYTGAIFEVKTLEGTLGSSICGGGRYDDLTGIFGLKGMSGVGISFGADRIYDVLAELGRFPAEMGGTTKLLFANFGEQEAMQALRMLREVRAAGIAAELYPDTVKLPKQFTYAEKKGIPWVAIVGESEVKEGKVTLKRMGAGEKGELMTIEQVIERVR